LKNDNFWKELPRPIKVLSPMAGYTDSAFRVLCRQYGADVVMTELISADAITFGKFEVESRRLKVESDKEESFFYKVTSNKNQSTGDLLSFFDEERPIVIQLFGKYPEKFAFAAKWISQNLKPDGIDINMGCPARKVVRSGHGAALMQNPGLAVEIIEAVKDNTNLPVSVKTRLGWENKDEILEFAPILAHAGIDALTIHARTYKQGFKGVADWENIYKVKSILPDLTVIGNGDIKQISNFKAANFKPSTVNYLDGFAIGRAAFGKPWIFSRDSVTIEELKKVILTHAELVFAAKGEYGLIEFRKHLLAYLKGDPKAKELRREAVAISAISDIKKIIEKIT